MVSVKRMILLAKTSAKHLISQNTHNPFQAHFLSPLSPPPQHQLGSSSSFRPVFGQFSAIFDTPRHPSTPSNHPPSSKPLNLFSISTYLHSKWVISSFYLVDLIVFWSLILVFDYWSCCLYGIKSCFDILVVDYVWKQVMLEVVHVHASVGFNDEVWLF